MANEIPIDVVLRAQDEMSVVLDKAAKESLALADAFGKTEDAAKKATGITWDETTKRWRDANRGFISSAKALEAGFTDADKAVFKYERQIKEAAKATDSMGKSMAEGGTASSGFGVKMVALGNIAADLAMKAFSAVASTVGDVAKAMIDGNAEFQQYEVQFGVLLKSSSAAKKRLQELAEFGAKTPFELPEVVRADKILQSFGLHSEEAAKKFGFSGEQIRVIAGDMAAGTDSSFEDMARYLGRFASGATGETISRFEELGITTREELAKMGLEFSKSGELTTPTAEAFTVLLKVAQDKMGGMMDAQSKTFNGMMSNLNDWKQQTLTAIGEPIFEVLNEKFALLLEFLGSPEVQASITDFANGLAATIKTAITFIEEQFIPAVQSVISFFNDLFASADESFGGVEDIVTNALATIEELISSVTAVIMQIWEEHGDSIMSTIKEVWSIVSEIVSTAVGIIARLIEMVFGQMTSDVQGSNAKIMEYFTIAWDTIRTVVLVALDIIKGLLSSALKFLNGDTQGALDTLKRMFETIWGRIREVIGTEIDTAVAWVKLVLFDIGKWIDGKLQDIENFFVTTWTNISNTVEYWVNTIKNRSQAIFQELRDDTILKFNEIKRAILDAMGLSARFQMPAGTGTFIAPTFDPNAANRASRGGGISTGNRSAMVTVNVYGGDAATAERGVVAGLQRAGFAIVR